MNKNMQKLSDFFDFQSKLSFFESYMLISILLFALCGVMYLENNILVVCGVKFWQ